MTTYIKVIDYAINKSRYARKAIDYETYKSVNAREATSCAIKVNDYAKDTISYAKDEIGLVLV